MVPAKRETRRKGGGKGIEKKRGARGDRDRDRDRAEMEGENNMSNIVVSFVVSCVAVYVKECITCHMKKLEGIYNV